MKDDTSVSDNSILVMHYQVDLVYELRILKNYYEIISTENIKQAELVVYTLIATYNRFSMYGCIVRIHLNTIYEEQRLT